MWRFRDPEFRFNLTFTFAGETGKLVDCENADQLADAIVRHCQELAGAKPQQLKVSLAIDHEQRVTRYDLPEGDPRRITVADDSHMTVTMMQGALSAVHRLDNKVSKLYLEDFGCVGSCMTALTTDAALHASRRLYEEDTTLCDVWLRLYDGIARNGTIFRDERSRAWWSPRNCTALGIVLDQNSSLHGVRTLKMLCLEQLGSVEYEGASRNHMNYARKRSESRERIIVSNARRKRQRARK